MEKVTLPLVCEKVRIGEIRLELVDGKIAATVTAPAPKFLMEILDGSSALIIKE